MPALLAKLRAVSTIPIMLPRAGWAGSRSLACRVKLKPKSHAFGRKGSGRSCWPFLPQPLSTEEARRVLPPQYSRADSVVNIQNSMLLLAAFTQGRADLLTAALEDRIHQPYRASLCPLLAGASEAGRDARRSGCSPERCRTVRVDVPRSRAAKRPQKKSPPGWRRILSEKNLVGRTRCLRPSLKKEQPRPSKTRS